MVLTNEHVSFAQKIKTTVASLGELEEVVKARMALAMDVNLWCALPGGSGEPERVTELASLPLLAKVYVKPASVSIIAVVHNGDLAHGLMMEASPLRNPAVACGA